MNALKKCLIAWMFVQVTLPALAGPAPSKAEGSNAKRAAAPQAVADRYARRCQSQAPNRGDRPQGTLLWGTKQRWDAARAADDRSSVLVSADLDRLRQADAGVKALKLEGARLSPAPATAGGTGAVGTVLQGTAGDGQPVEVAICGSEPAPDDPEMIWYRIEAWNPVTQDWENPCVATGSVPDPRALAVSGLWDSSGAHHDAPGKITFACENGAITKCARWGYKPWATRDGHSLADLHQACTRMARADYCGNGRSHTHEDTTIDMYDSLGVQSRTMAPTANWDPARGSFEAAWAQDGAACLGHTRDGRALETILQECPGRFQAGSADLGQGDRCAVQRPGMNAASVMLRNRSYGAPKGAGSPAGGM